MERNYIYLKKLEKVLKKNLKKRKEFQKKYNNKKSKKEMTVLSDKWIKEMVKNHEYD